MMRFPACHVGVTCWGLGVACGLILFLWFPIDTKQQPSWRRGRRWAWWWWRSWGWRKKCFRFLIIFVGLGPKGARQAFLFHCNTWTETFFYRQKRAYLISQELLLNCSPWNIGRITLEVVVVALIRKTVIDWDHTLLWGFACFFQTGIEG